jgi:DNA-binding LacI/PurR family transcriptional regulator
MKKKRQGSNNNNKVTLQELADQIRLTKGTVSTVLNDAPSAKRIPQHTKDRIFAAAERLNYSPNFFARGLVNKRTFMVGVITEEIGDAYGGMVISGIEATLRQHKYLFVTVAHRHEPEWLQQYLDILPTRGVEGFITVDTSITRPVPLPVVAVAGHRRVKGITNIILDHKHAAVLALKHLAGLGHREIVYFRGQLFSSDSVERWRSICEVAAKLGIAVRPELTVQLRMDDPSPHPAYELTRALLAKTRNFTAVFAYNDISAIGAIRALREAGIRVPEDVSVVGFDDIRDAAYHVPSLTTVRQPLRRMGEIAAQTLVDRIEGRKAYVRQIALEPELVIRESTGKAVPEQRVGQR